MTPLSLVTSEEFSYTQPMSDELPNPHDMFFKGVFTRREIVIGFIEHYVPKEISSQYVLRTGAVTIQQVKEVVRELPHGEETVETTADILRKEGEQRGEQRGELKKTRDLLLRNINARFGTINRDLIEQIKAIQSVEILDGLFDLSLRVSSFDELKEQVLRATDN